VKVLFDIHDSPDPWTTTVSTRSTSATVEYARASWPTRKLVLNMSER